MQALDKAKRLSQDIIRLQYAAMDNLCAAFNDMVEGATLRFYPYGGSLYRMFMPQNTSKYTRTNDVDGFLVVVPDNVTLQDCLTTDSEHYNMIVERILDVYETLHETLWRPDAFAQWMRRSSTDAYTMSCDDFMQAFKGASKLTYSLLQPWDRNTFREYYVLSTSLTIFQELLPLTMNAHGEWKAMVDVHFGVLQPIRDSMTGRLCEIMAKATPWPGYRHVWKQDVFTFFVEQCRTAVECLHYLYSEAVLPDTDGYDNSDFVRRLMTQQGPFQSFVKAEKRLYRVNELVQGFPHISRMMLKSVYAIHSDDVFAPALKYTFDVVNKRKTYEFLQTTALKKKVRDFNSVIKWGEKERNRRRKQEKVGEEEATRSDLAKALRKPLREMMAIMRLKEHNEVSLAFTLSDDVTVGEMMHLLLFLFERLRDRVDDIMRRAQHKQTLIVEAKKKKKKAQAMQGAMQGAAGGEEKAGNLQLRF